MAAYQSCPDAHVGTESICARESTHACHLPALCENRLQHYDSGTCGSFHALPVIKSTIVTVHIQTDVNRENLGSAGGWRWRDAAAQLRPALPEPGGCLVAAAAAQTCAAHLRAGGAYHLGTGAVPKTLMLPKHPLFAFSVWCTTCWQTHALATDGPAQAQVQYIKGVDSSACLRVLQCNTIHVTASQSQLPRFSPSVSISFAQLYLLGTFGTNGSCEPIVM